MTANTITQRNELSIIVVDDMKFNCEFIRRALNHEGYSDVRVAAGAAEALALLAEKPADVVIADWVMPEMDGLELTARIRQIDEEKERYTCILLLTARDDTASLIEAFERGVDDYLIKPPDKQELAARIYAAGRIATLQNGLLDSMRAMREEYERHVTVDNLTGLGNRLDAERRFSELLQLVGSRGGAVCCGYLALNDAEALRQQHGEEVYQEILCSIAKRLRRAVRPGDVVARLSENEFALGMYYLDENQVRSKTFKRIMQSINLRPCKTSRGFITISAAMAVCCAHEGGLYEGGEALMHCAGEKIELSRQTGSTEVAL